MPISDAPLTGAEQIVNRVRWLLLATLVPLLLILGVLVAAAIGAGGG